MEEDETKRAHQILNAAIQTAHIIVLAYSATTAIKSFAELGGNGAKALRNRSTNRRKKGAVIKLVE